MDVREKLVDIAERASVRTLPKNTCHTNIVMLVNALIEEGVTVQEWISVKDRLPERFVYVLAMTDFGEAAVARLKGNGRWYIGWDNGQYAGITHWMPLPQPPKGE